MRTVGRAALAAVMLMLCLPATALATHTGCGFLGLEACPHPQSPDPGGQETPNQGVPAPNVRIGFNTFLFLHGRATVQQELDWGTGAGSSVQRFPVVWRGLQPRSIDPPLPDEADVGPGEGPGGRVHQLDVFYEAALARGVTPIFVTFAAPAWASKYRSCGVLDIPCQQMADSNLELVPDYPFLDEYEAFVRAVKARWPQALIEPWNEPNLHWNHPDYQGPRAYAAWPGHMAQIQCSAYRGSKAVNPDPVLASGWALTTEAGGNYVQYVDGVYAAGGQDCWDLANAHLYFGTQVVFGPNSLMALGLDRIRQLRSKWGDTDPIWITEVGYTTSGPTTHAVTADCQANALRRAYNRFVTMGDISAVIFHTLRDAPTPGNDDPAHQEYGYGFLRQDGTPKPVYEYFSTQASSGSGTTPACGAFPAG